MILWGWIDAGLKSLAGVPINGHVFSAAEIAFSVLPPVGVFWFLYTLFILHVVAWGVVRLPRPLMLGTMAVLAIAARVGWINVSPFDSLWNTVIYLPPFFGGIAFAILAGHGALLRKSLIFPALLAFALGQALLVAPAIPGKATFATVLATLGFIALVANLPLGAAATRWLQWLGQHTMPIYLPHVIFSAATRLALRQFGVEAWMPHLTLGIIAGLAGPLLLIWLAKRVGLSVLLGFEPPTKAHKTRMAMAA